MSKVLILGAGASYGHGVHGVSHPPLVNGFFSHQSMKKLRPSYLPLFRYLKNFLGISAKHLKNMNIEILFAKVEQIWKTPLFDMDPDARIARYGEEFELVTPLDLLRSLLVDIICLSTDWLRTKECPYHNFLVSNWLESGDTVITLNYDLIVDVSLLRSTLWNEYSGYGWRYPVKRLGQFYYDEFKFADSKIKLIKLHGSINWWRYYKWEGITRESQEKKDAIAIDLISDILRPGKKSAWKKFPPEFGLQYSKFPIKYVKSKIDSISEAILLSQKKNMYPLYENGFMPLIITPTPYKPFAEMAFAELRNLWKLTRKSLEKADELVICGYSYNDEHLNKTLVESTRIRTKPLPLTVVDVNEDVFEKAKTFLNESKIIPKNFFKGLSAFAKLE